MVQKAAPYLPAAQIPTGDAPEAAIPEQLSESLLDDLLYLTDRLGTEIQIAQEPLHLPHSERTLPALKLTDGGTGGIFFTMVQDTVYLYDGTHAYLYQSGALEQALTTMEDGQAPTHVDVPDADRPHRDDKAPWSSILHRLDRNRR